MSRINNYAELVAERRKVERHITEQKLILQSGLHDLKEKLEPFLYLLPMLNVFKKQESGHPVLKFVSSLGIDLLVGQKLLSRANWFARLVVPALLKSLSRKAIGSMKSEKEIETAADFPAAQRGLV